MARINVVLTANRVADTMIFTPPAFRYPCFAWRRRVVWCEWAGGAPVCHEGAHLLADLLVVFLEVLHRVPNMTVQ